MHILAGKEQLFLLPLIQIGCMVRKGMSLRWPGAGAGQGAALQSWGSTHSRYSHTLVSWGTAYSISSTPSALWYTRSNFPGSLATEKPSNQLKELQTTETLSVYHKRWSKPVWLWGLFWVYFFVFSVGVHECNKKSWGKTGYYTPKLR